MSATKCDSWTNFVREIESIEHARKTITAPTPMELDALSRKLSQVREVRTLCERMSEFEPWRGREASMRTMWEETSWTMLDPELHITPQRFTERRTERRQKKETARQPRKVESPKEEKAETMGKEKVEEERTTYQRNHRTIRRTVDRWILGTMGQNNVGTQKPTLRVGGTMIGTQQIRILGPQRQLKNFIMRLSVICDSRIWVLSNTSNVFNMNDWILHRELSHAVLIPQHAKLLFLPITLQHVGIWSTKTPHLDVRTALQAEAKCMIKE